MQPNHPQGPRSRQAGDWRDARALVIEGEARVVSREGGKGRNRFEPTAAPRWGAALDAAAALAPAHPRLARIAVPAGLALAVLVALALSPGEGEQHGAADPAVRVASAAVVR